MASHERRNAVALDDAYLYCRRLETRAEAPDLFRLCNAIRTLDLALEAHNEAPLPMTLCSEAWSRVRDSLFNTLVSSQAGYFFVYDENDILVEPGTNWPEKGAVEFFPDGINRKNESYRSSFQGMRRSVINPLRWAFAEGRQQTHAQDFIERESAPDTSAMPERNPEVEAEEARELLERMYNVCEEQAVEGKKKAHRRWWQLYWEANSCPNKRRKHELQKQMVALQSIWGTPAE